MDNADAIYLTTDIACGLFGSISIICLVYTIAVYVVLKRVSDLWEQCIMMILIYWTILTLMRLRYHAGLSIDKVCLGYYLSIYLYGGGMTWLLLLSFVTWISIVYPHILLNNKKLILFSCMTYGVVVPIFLAVIPLIGTHTPGGHLKPFHADTCYMTSMLTIFLYVYAGRSVLCAKSAIFLGLTLWKLWQNSKIVPANNFKLQKSKLMLSLLMFLIINCASLWAELLSGYIFVGYFRLIGTYTQSLLGIFLFLLLVVSRKSIRHEVLLKMGCGVPVQPRAQAEGTEDIQELTSTANETRNEACIYNCRTESLSPVVVIEHPSTDTNVVL